jgi:hypothetical protein
MTAKLLAGPILRRTTNNRVCVWLATTQPLSLRLNITDAQGKSLGQSKLEDLNQQRVQLGENLWIYLLQARPDEDTGFLSDTLMCYHLDEDDTNGGITPMNLADLAYGKFRSPSFFIPSKLKQLLHGSCRKPHGGFDAAKQEPLPDALSHGEALLAKTYDDLDLRPAILLLTGDQIYADDVSISLLAMLRQQALAITGKQETLPLVDCAFDQDISSAPLDPSSIPLHGRKQALSEKLKTFRDSSVEKDSGFSSKESENHLFTFGEFATMYIYAFGNLPGWEPVWDWPQLEKMGVISPSEDAKEAWTKQDAPLRSFHKTLSHVRKLLANVSTYMIFDDHDVTDDWNITGDWYDGVRDSPMGRRIVSNALASYWAFQAWGNDPDNFDKDLIITIKQQLIGKDESVIGDRYDLHTWKSRGWGFSIPTEPPIIAMDSRTQRQYENKYYPALLLDRYALDWLRVEWAKLKTGQNINAGTCPVIIASTPVMGFSTIEFFQQLALWLAGFGESWKPVQVVERLAGKEGFITGWLVNTLDAESWSSNKKGFVGFMDTLSRRMGIKRCVFLSGDVHYAFTAEARCEYQNRVLQCYQLTSSALSNEPDGKQARFLEEAAKHDTGIKTHRNWTLLPDRHWTAKVQLLQAESSDLRIVAKCNLGLVEFDNGLPVSHTLLTGDGKIVFHLPIPAVN